MVQIKLLLIKKNIMEKQYTYKISISNHNLSMMKSNIKIDQLFVFSFYPINYYNYLNIYYYLTPIN